MKLLDWIVDAFVNTFGITRPSPRDRAAAGRFIAGMLVAVMVVLAAAAWLLRNAFSQR